MFGELINFLYCYRSNVVFIVIRILSFQLSLERTYFLITFNLYNFTEKLLSVTY